MDFEEQSKLEFGIIFEILTDKAAGFFSSAEYGRLHPDDKVNPGLLCASFSRYFAALQRADTVSPLLGQDKENLACCYEAIEGLASSDNDGVQNQVTTEIFENIDENDISDAAFREKLKPISREIFIRWGRGVGMDGYGNPI